MADEVFDPEVHAANPDGSPKLKADGTFARRRGPRKGAAPSPTRRATKASPKQPDYRPGLNNMFQMVAIPLSFKAPLDALAVTHHAPPIAEALNDLAHEQPQVAAVLDRVLAVGPYTALFAAVTPLVLQILHNHDVLPEQVAAPMGVTPKRQIEAELAAHAAAMQQAQASDAQREEMAGV